MPRKKVSKPWEPQPAQQAPATLTREQALDLRTATTLSSFHEHGDAWILYHTRGEAQDPVVGFHDSQGGHREETFPHMVEAGQRFNELRTAWLDAHRPQ